MTPVRSHHWPPVHPEKLVVHSGANDHVWFVTSMLVSAIGVGLMTLPHSWPALISHATVVLASTLALVLGIFRPDLPANLLVLTCSGSVQPAPANLLGFLRRVPVVEAA